MRNSQTLFIPCLALTMALAGCNRQDTSPATADTETTTTSETAPAASPLRTGPVGLDELMASTDTIFHEVAGDDLEAINEGMSCSLDSVNALTPGAAPVSTGGDLTLSGWIQRKAAVKDQLLVVLRGKKSYGFRGVLGSSRPDIAKTINVEDIADFLASSGLTGVEPDEYSVYLVRSGDSGLAKCVADAKLTIQ